jgi:hypothetical protein
VHDRFNIGQPDRGFEVLTEWKKLLGATIEANLMRLMAKLPPGTRLEDRANSSRGIAPDVIVCHGVSHRIASDGLSTEMYFVRVLVRQGDRWLLAATQIARPSTLPKSSPQPK